MNDQNRLHLYFFLNLIIIWSEDMFFFMTLFNKHFVFQLFILSLIHSSQVTFFHNVSGSLPEQCFLKMPLLPSLFRSEGAVKTWNHPTLFYLINLSSPQCCHDIAYFCCLCRDAKAMYSCEAEHSHELSFPQGAHFSNGEQRQQKANKKKKQ